MPSNPNRWDSGNSARTSAGSSSQPMAASMQSASAGDDRDHPHATGSRDVDAVIEIVISHWSRR